MSDIDVKNALTYIVTVLLTIVIGMTGFWLMMGRDYVTRTEVETMNTNTKFYLQERLDIYMTNQDRLHQVISRNSEAMAALKVELIQLGETLKYIERELDKKQNKVSHITPITN